MWTEQQAAEIEICFTAEANHSKQDINDPELWFESALAFEEDGVLDVGYVEYCLAKASGLEARGVEQSGSSHGS